MLLGTGVVVPNLASVLLFEWPHVAVVASMLVLVLTLISTARLRRTRVAELLRSTDAARIERTVEKVLPDAGLIPVLLGGRHAAEDALAGIDLARQPQIDRALQRQAECLSQV